MIPTVPWPALASIAAGCGALYTVRQAWVHRDQPGGVYWIGFIVAIGVWSLSYGVGLLVFDPFLRRAVGVPIWLAKSLVPPLFLGFALAYTGRTHLATSWAVRANLALWVGIGVFEALNPLHGLMWQGYRLNPVFASATVSMEIQPLLYGAYVLSYLELTVALLLLLEALLQYGSVYRRQILALVLGAALPTATTAIWVFRLSPVPQLNLTPIAISATVVAGYYALFHGELFEVSPSTQRAADRAALDDLGSAVVIITPEDRIVDLNATAERVFSTDRSRVLGRPVSRLVDLDPETLTASDADETVVSVRVDGERRVFKLSESVLTDATGRTVGSTLVFQDVTVERQREQRLQVLNRVLRHNLRNDMNVIEGYLDTAASRIEDER
ncbi:MAG: histidine kinase N-terminal 7TM domain-containing protein, partial [Halobaculum sp.]